MKEQDIIFLLVMIFLIWKRNPKWFAVAGLLCLCVSIPLFYKWIFFTAERLTWYAAAFFLLSILLIIVNKKK